MVVLFISQAQAIQESLVEILGENNGTEVRGASSREAVEAVATESPPSLVVVDSAHPEATTLVAAVRMLVPEVDVLVLVMREGNENLPAWAEIGVSGYIASFS
jgi:DNA-binding NarL/FixJ family response regulator